MPPRSRMWIFKFGLVVVVFLSQSWLGGATHQDCEPLKPSQRLAAYADFNYTHSIRTNSSHAQRLFDLGMVLAAGYNQEDALGAFRAALSYDGLCAMCWWGVAYAMGPFQNKPAVKPPDNPIAAAQYQHYSEDDMLAAVKAINNAAALVGLVPLAEANETAAATAAAMRARLQQSSASGTIAAGAAVPPPPGGGFLRLVKRLHACRKALPKPPKPPPAGTGRRLLAADPPSDPIVFAPDIPAEPSLPPPPFPPPPPFSLSPLATERHYIAAMADRLSVRTVWGADWEWAERRYAKDMMELAACVPTEADAPALAAEALANLTPWDFVDPLTGLPRETTPLVLAMVATSLERNPLQPLALHLHIHVTEGLPAGRGNVSAGLAEGSADRLLGLLPSLDHLQHMPAHNYVRVGRWADAVESNIASLRASVNGTRSCLTSLYPEHSAALLVFAASMGADRERATVYARVLRELPRFIDDAPASVGYQWPALLLVWVRFTDWSLIRQAPPPPVSSDDPRLPPLLAGSWPPQEPADAPVPLADVITESVLDPMLALDPGPLRGPLADSDYDQDGATYAVVVWYFARLMAFSADLEVAKEVAGVSSTRQAPPPPAHKPPPPDPTKSETEIAAEALIHEVATEGDSFNSAELATMAKARQRVDDTYALLQKAELLVPPDVAMPPGQGLGVGVPGYKLLSTMLMRMADARLAVLDSNLTAAAHYLTLAVAAEEEGGYFEPPRLGPQPARQCLGAVALAQGRLAEALEIYLADLAVYPSNPWSIRGLSDGLDKVKLLLQHMQSGGEGPSDEKLAGLQALVVRAQQAVDEALEANQAAVRATAVSCPAFFAPPRQG